MQPWIRVRVEFPPFFSPFSPRTLGRVWEPNSLHGALEPLECGNCSQTPFLAHIPILNSFVPRLIYTAWEWVYRYVETAGKSAPINI